MLNLVLNFCFQQAYSHLRLRTGAVRAPTCTRTSRPPPPTQCHTTRLTWVRTPTTHDKAPGSRPPRQAQPPPSEVAASELRRNLHRVVYTECKYSARMLTVSFIHNEPWCVRRKTHDLLFPKVVLLYSP